VNFDWTADQEAFRASVRGFATRLAAREAPDGFDREAWGACARFGIQGLVVPEELGGSGAGALTAAAALEALGEGGPDAGLLFSLNAQMWAVQHPLVRFGSPEQQQRYLPGLCDGSLIGAHASTEPDAGSDVFSLRTRAVADRDHMGLCAFLVDRDTPGLEVGAPLRKMGLRGSPIADLHLDDCRVPADAMLGRRGGGMAVFTSAMEWERTLILASVLGAMQRQLDQCVAFANERRQFDQPIAGFQAVSHRIVGMKLRLDAGRLLLQRAAWLLDEGRSAASEAALAKWWVAESYLASSLDAVQVHGGAGYLEDTGLSSAVADAVAARIYSGTSEMQMNVVAHHLGLDQ
jgi:alkylation response protein AidB-like acyl-CoA dehydrogenase